MRLPASTVSTIFTTRAEHSIYPLIKLEWVTTLKKEWREKESLLSEGVSLKSRTGLRTRDGKGCQEEQPVCRHWRVMPTPCTEKPAEVGKRSRQQSGRGRRRKERSAVGEGWSLLRGACWSLGEQKARIRAEIRTRPSNGDSVRQREEGPCAPRPPRRANLFGSSKGPRLALAGP